MGLLDNDYGAGAIGDAVKGLLQGMQQGDQFKLQKDTLDENRKFREMEFTSKMKAEDLAKQRQTDTDAWNKKKDVADYGVKLGAQGKLVPHMEQGKSLLDVPYADLKDDPNAIKRIQAQASAERAKNGYGSGAATNVRTTRLAMNAMNEIKNDKVILPMRQQATAINRGQRLMDDPSKPISNKTMSEIAQDYSQALNNGKVSSDFKLKEISTPTLQGKLAEVMSYVNSNPDQPAPPAVVKFWKEFGQRLQGAYGRQMAARANELTKTDNLVFKNYPDLIDARKQAAGSYLDNSWSYEGDDYEEPMNQHEPMNKINPNDPKVKSELEELKALKAKAGR